MNFIINLPPSRSFNNIFMIVDCLTKMTHFVPWMKIITINEIARLFLHNIYWYHGSFFITIVGSTFPTYRSFDTITIFPKQRRTFLATKMAPRWKTSWMRLMSKIPKRRFVVDCYWSKSILEDGAEFVYEGHFCNESWSMVSNRRRWLLL